VNTVTDPYSAHAYRDTEVLSATPGRLVVITFDGLLASLARARFGFQARNPDLALPAIERARGFLGELLGSLDRERGGDMAVRLANIYIFVLTEMQSIVQTQDVKRLDAHIALLRELRDAFFQVSSAKRPAVA
jgi:flagellar protein FliS